MRLPTYGQEATGGTPDKPVFQAPDILHEKHINIMMYSLWHLLEQAGVEAIDGEFDANDPNTYNRVFEAIRDLQSGRDIGKLGFRICQPDKLPDIALQ